MTHRTLTDPITRGTPMRRVSRVLSVVAAVLAAVVVADVPVAAQRMRPRPPVVTRAPAPNPAAAAARRAAEAQRQARQAEQRRRQQEIARQRQAEQQQYQQRQQAAAQAAARANAQANAQGRASAAAGASRAPNGRMEYSNGLAKANRPPTSAEIARGFTGKFTKDGRALVKVRNRILVVPASRVGRRPPAQRPPASQQAARTSRPAAGSQRAAANDNTRAARAKAIQSLAGKKVVDLRARFAAARAARSGGTGGGGRSGSGGTGRLSAANNNAKVFLPPMVPAGHPYSATVVRAAPEEYVAGDTKIHAGNVLASHRYSEQGYGAIYSSLSPEAMVAEKVHAEKLREEEMRAKKMPYEPADSMARVARVNLKNVLDLTDPEVRKALQIDEADLLGENYGITQGIGRWARDHYDGIIVPSARAPGQKNIVIWDERSIK